MADPDPVQEIEERAAAELTRVPDWIWDGERLPVPVEDIADSCHGLLIRDVADMTAAPGAPELEPDQALSGLLLAARGEIWVNADEARQWPRRRRFTIGHELGHWVMHRAGQQSLFCRSTRVTEGGSGPEHPPTLDREGEANAFAAALTMPAHLIRHHYERLRGRDDRFEQMCGVFHASGAAMGRRLHTVV